MPHAALVRIHVIAGALGLLLGPLAMYHDTRRLDRGLGAAARPA